MPTSQPALKSDEQLALCVQRLYGNVAREAERRLKEKARYRSDGSQQASSRVEASSGEQAGNPVESQASPSESSPSSS